jgi:hypothetical protein
MAYKTHELEAQALKEITARKLVYLTEVVSYLPCDKTTFYAHKLNQSTSIKEALERNRIDLKLKIRQKLLDSDNPIAMIASYKLFADENELERLSTNNKQAVNHTQTKPFSFTLNLNPINELPENEPKQLTGETNYIDVESDDDYEA